jgi:hypothetical protein
MRDFYDIPTYVVVIESSPNTLIYHYATYYLELAEMYRDSMPDNDLIIVKMYDMHNYTKVQYLGS